MATALLPAVRYRAVLAGAVLGTIIVATVMCGSEPSVDEIDAWVRTGHYDQAVAALRAQMSKLAKDPAVEAWRLGDFQRKLSLIETLRVQEPEWQQAYLETDALLGQFKNAFEADERGVALDVARRAFDQRAALLGIDHWEMFEAYNALGNALEMFDNYEQSRPLFEAALRLTSLHLETDHPLRASAMNDLACTVEYLDEYRRAEILYREAAAIERRKELSPGDLAITLNNLGTNLREQGDYTQAEVYLREALEMRRSAFGPVHPAVVQSQNNLAVLFIEEDRWEDGRELLETARQNCQQLGDSCSDLWSILQGLAVLSHNLRDYEQAEQYVRDALALKAEPSATLLVNHAKILAKLGRSGEAERRFEEALERSNRVAGPLAPLNVWILNQYADLRLGERRLEAAESLLERSSRVYETARLTAPTERNRARLLISPYGRLAFVRLLRGKEHAAWQAIERFQGRTLVDTLVATDARQLTLGERSTESALLEQLRIAEMTLRDAVERAGPEEVRAAQSKFERAEAGQLEFREALEASHPRTEAGLFEFARIQAVLRSDEAILGWLIDTGSRESDSAWGYIIKRQGPVTWVRLPIDSEAALPGNDLALNVSSPQLKEFDTVATWKARFAPLESHLSGLRKLIVIPSGDLLGLPVEILQGERGGPIGERFLVSYAPSASALSFLRERPSRFRKQKGRPTILALADPVFDPRAADDPSSPRSVLRGGLNRDPASLKTLPRLKSTRAEAEKLVSWGGPGSVILLGEQSTESQIHEMAVADRLRDFDLLHFATHAVVDPKRFGYSFLVLSMVGNESTSPPPAPSERPFDGLVTEREILSEWKLDAELVALTGCETGLGERRTGEGYLGLADAMFQAGARNLLVTLWKVDDQASSKLVSRFYENLFSHPGDMTKAEALQEAKIWLRDWTDANGHRPYEHPFFWAPFILIGDAA